MIRVEWNALRVGQHVLVHDETDASWALVQGCVTMVQDAPGSNDVAIRIPSARGPSRVVHPRRLVVHPEQLDPEARCWRCEALADEALRQRRRAPTNDVTK